MTDHTIALVLFATAALLIAAPLAVMVLDHVAAEHPRTPVKAVVQPTLKDRVSAGQRRRTAVTKDGAYAVRWEADVARAHADFAQADLDGWIDRPHGPVTIADIIPPQRDRGAL